MNKEQLIADIKAMTVLELNELVTALEEEFGVSAMVAAAPAQGGGDQGNTGAAVQTEFDVVLKSAGQEKVKVIKVVRELTGLGLKEAKDLVDSAPKAVKEGLPEEECNKIAEQLKAAGAEVEIK